MRATSNIDGNVIPAETGRMSFALPMLYLARHGETAWTVCGQHARLTHLPPTEHGQQNVRKLEERLKDLTVARVFTNRLQRAACTCALGGFGAVAELDPHLVKWNYGAHEGVTAAEIHAQRAEWQLFRVGCPGGESPDQVGGRAGRVVGRLRASQGDVLLFSSGHFLRVLAVRWLALEPRAARCFVLSAASLSALRYERNLT